MSARPAAVFAQLLGAFIFLLLIGFAVLYRSFKRKDQFYHLTGVISSLTRSLDVEGERNLTDEEFRYIRMEDVPRIFRLQLEDDFIGSKAVLDKVDGLKVGDTITLYYDDTFSSKDKEVNYLTQVVEKDQQPYFIRDNQDRPRAFFVLGLSAVSIAVILLLKKKGKIA